METTAFFTRCWTKWLEACAWVALAVCFSIGPAAYAQTGTGLQQFSLAHTDDGLFVTASVAYEPAAAVADALARSVPLYFVAQLDVMRERWYWADARVATASRTYRLAYQPLTRRWRVSVASGSGPAANLQYALHQNHDSLRQALAAVTRLYGWKVAAPQALAREGAQYVNFRFKLDMALLPRPFQMGMNAQSDWSVDIQHTQPVPPLTAAGQGSPTDVGEPPVVNANQPSE